MESINSIKSAQLNGTVSQYEIPATMRQDGSWRKARKVKPGFVPQEEVPLYTPKGKRVQAQTSQYPPGWHPAAAAAQTNVAKPRTEKPKPTQSEKPKSQQPDKPKSQPADKAKSQAADKPKPPQQEKPKKKLEVAKFSAEEVSEKLRNLAVSSAASDPTIEISKKLKRLRRRLREAEQLDEKLKTGAETPNADQLEKIARRKEFEDEIEQLEAEREQLRKLKPT